MKIFRDKPKVDRWCNEIKRIYLPVNCYFKGRQVLVFFFSLLHLSACDKISVLSLNLGCQRADETNKTQNNLNKITAVPFRCFFVDLLTCVIRIDIERITQSKWKKGRTKEKKKFAKKCKILFRFHRSN